MFRIFCALFLFVALATTSLFAEEVRIVRDDYGVPHIYAESEEGVLFGQGYAMAKDRLFQLELCRLSASGNMAATLGSAYVEYDKQNRKYFPVGEELAHFTNSMPENRIALFKAFVSGINARLAEVKDSDLPQEFSKYGIQLKPWTVPELVKVILDRHKYVYDSNEELLNESLLSYLKESYSVIDAELIFNSLLRLDESGSSPVALKNTQAAKKAYAFEKKAYALNRYISKKFAAPYGIGSYAVLVFPSKSSSNNSLLLAGPQVGFTSPPFFYECGLHCKSLNAYGIQSIGIPGLTIGQNEESAWSVTGGLDNQLDYYKEILNPKDHTQYWYCGSWKKFSEKSGYLTVKGSNPCSYKFYSTVHGPVILTDTTDPKHPIAYSKKCAVTPKDIMVAWDDSYKLLKSNSVDSFVDSVKDYPIATNFFYINKRYSPIFFHAGKYPIRPVNADLRLPLKGDGTQEWNGYLPFEQLPFARTAVMGYWADWNSRPIPTWNNGERALYWGSQNRINSIKNFLDADKKKITFRDLDLLDRKFSYNSKYAADTKDSLVALLEKNADPDVAAAVAILKDWDGTISDASGVEPAGNRLFSAWMKAFVKVTMPELKDEFTIYAINEHGAPFIYNMLHSVPLKYDFLRGRSLEHLAAVAMKSAYDSLKDESGNIAPSAPTEMLFSSIDITPPDASPIPSEIKCSNVGNRASAIFMWEVNRFWNKGVTVLPPGESIQVSKEKQHYKDQLPLYENRMYKTILFYEEDVRHHMSSEMKLNYEPVK